MKLARSHGYTLIELSLVMTIVSILAVLSSGSYREYLSRARRTEALGAAGDVYIAQSAWYAEKNAYASDFATLVFAIDGTRATSAAQLTGRVYTYQLSLSGSKYLFTATGEIDGDPWPDEVASLATRTPTIAYDDVYDSYSPIPGASAAGSSTPTPSATATASSGACNQGNGQGAGQGCVNGGGNGNGNSGHGRGRGHGHGG